MGVVLYVCTARNARDLAGTRFSRRCAIDAVNVGRERPGIRKGGHAMSLFWQWTLFLIGILVFFSLTGNPITL